MYTGFTPVRYDNALHRTLLAAVYCWAQERPDAYLEGTGYQTREHFFEPPPDSVEFFVMVDGKPAALLTFIRLRDGVFQAGLITAPKARLRPLIAALRGVRSWLPGCGCVELWVKLPVRACYDVTRKLVEKIGFEKVNNTDWKLEMVDGNAK